VVTRPPTIRSLLIMPGRVHPTITRFTVGQERAGLGGPGTVVERVLLMLRRVPPILHPEHKPEMRLSPVSVPEIDTGGER